jgi:hypothetical protein
MRQQYQTWYDIHYAKVVQEFPAFHETQKYHHVQKNPKVFPILKEINPVHSTPNLFLILHLPMYDPAFHTVTVLQTFISVHFLMCHMARMVLHLISLIGLKFGKKYKLLHSSLRHFFRALLPLPSSVQTVFVLRKDLSYILSVHCSYHFRRQASHPYKVTSKITRVGRSRGVPPIFFIRKYNCNYNEIYTYHRCILYKAKIVFSQSSNVINTISLPLLETL